MSDSSGQGGTTKSGSDGGSTENKRKFLFENRRTIVKMSSSMSVTEFRKHGVLEGKLDEFIKEFGSLEELEKNFQELEASDDEWDDPVACQLLEILFHDLQASLHRAIDKIVRTGYKKELAEQLILKSGLYHGLKDMPSNIVEGAFAFIRTGRDQGPLAQYVFPNLDKLVEFSLLEMVNILRQLKPCSSVTEAMWCLFICDLNLWHALAVPRDQLGLISFQDIPEESFSGLLPSMLELDSLQESFYTRHISKFFLLNREHNPPSSMKHFSSLEIPQKESSVSSYSYVTSLDINMKNTYINASNVQEKSGGSRKGSLSNMKREMLRQKVFCMEKSYKGRMYKGVFKAKLVPVGSKALDKALEKALDKALDKAHKLSSGSSCAVIKTTYSKHAVPLGARGPTLDGTSRDARNSTPTSKLSDASDMFSVKDTDISLPADDNKVPASLSLNSTSIATAEANNAGQSSEVPDYLAGITYDESLGKYIPKDDKEETILGLLFKMRALKKEIHDYTNWANEKVMQATRRLAKDQAELKMLRQEKGDGEKFKKENQTTEESTTKRVSEMEQALSNATIQFEAATSALCKLEDENTLLKVEAKAAEMMALRTKTDLQEALQREQEALKNYRSCDVIKVSLQKELTTLRRRNADLLSQLKIARGREEQLEVLRRQEEEEKLKYLEAATRKRNETEREKAQAKEKEVKMTEELESNIRKGKEDMKKLEGEMCKWRAFSESPRIAALLASAVGTGFSCSSIGNILSAASSHQGSAEVSKRLAFLQEKFEPDSVAPERECIMCMTEEMSVVFLPCAHQVLCSGCNILHEKQGMVDCPSCRTLIETRISVRY